MANDRICYLIHQGEPIRCHRHGDTIVISLPNTTYYLTPDEARRFLSQLGEDQSVEEKVDWRSEGF